MAPDRPDASSMDIVNDTNVARVFANEIKSTNASVEKNSGEENRDEVAAKSEAPMDKNAQSDDDLTPLSWLHQQNLLKGLDIPDPSKSVKDENILNNNVCDESTELSENTNSVSSLDDHYSPEGEEKASSCSPPQIRSASYQKQQSPSQAFSDYPKTNNHNILQNHQSKISLSNNNLPGANRSKHPTHIPYDPLLHKNSKPPYSFSCLIFMAIEDSPVKALPVKEVYAWILEHFPYFRSAPTGWKNSVRHNLSLNKCFRKVEKAPNLGKGSLWMVDSQYRPNLLQALSRAPFPPPTAQNISSPEKAQRKNTNNRLPDPVLFPYLSKRLASSNICESVEAEFDSDVDAAAAAMLSFKHGPIILNHNKDRKRKLHDSEKLVPVITRSSSEDHTYSCITSPKLESKRDPGVNNACQDFDEQRKIAEGADALLNLAGVSTTHSNNVPLSRSEAPLKTRKRPMPSDYSSSIEKRRRHWRDWGDGTCYLKQIRG